ncbi:hypothetical protein JZU46_05590 [bacterium]|nr:hypothetical protein [bacterium]
MNTTTSQAETIHSNHADAAMTCVMFLDFDGVVHPEPCNPLHYFAQLPLIEEVLREHPQVDVVISSSWRGVHALADLRGYFSSDIAPRVVGITPSNKKTTSSWLPGRMSSFERESECDDWMRDNRPWGTPFVAIDDRAHWFRPDSPELLLTQSLTGFTLGDQALLRAMLGERLGH